MMAHTPFVYTCASVITKTGYKRQPIIKRNKALKAKLLEIIFSLLNLMRSLSLSGDMFS